MSDRKSYMDKENIISEGWISNLISKIVKSLKKKKRNLDVKKATDTLNKHNIRTSTGKKFYRSLVWNIYKKRLKRNEFMSQPIVKEYRDFDIIFVERY